MDLDLDRDFDPAIDLDFYRDLESLSGGAAVISTDFSRELDLDRSLEIFREEREDLEEPDLPR